MNEELSEQETKSFTSWKLDILDAMSCDPNVDPIDFRVAFRVMQHVNARTRDAHPSLERIAAQLGVHRDTVMRSIKRLSDLEGGRHWISRSRTSRTEAYFYTFMSDRLTAVLDGKIDREERARDLSVEKKRRRFEVAALQRREVANLHTPEVANVHVHDVAGEQPKHLTKNYLNRTPDYSSYEKEGNSYARARDGY